MTILGEVTREIVLDTTEVFKTSYCNFYASMIKVPFFGTHYNTIMPAFILLLSLVFAMVSLLGLKNKAQTALKKYKKEIETKILKERDSPKKRKGKDKELMGKLNIA